MRTHPYRHHRENHISTHDTADLLFGSLLATVLVGLLLCIEKLSVHVFPFLQTVVHRKRALVEIHPLPDFCVQLIAFSSVPILSLWWNFQVFERYESGDQTPWVIVDALISVLIGSLTYLFTACAISKTIHYCQIKTPAMATSTADFIHQTESIPEILLQWQFKKEWALTIFTIFSVCANSLLLHYATCIQRDFENQPVFLGGSAALFILGYVLCKLRINYCHQQQKSAKKILQQNQVMMSTLAAEQLRSHDPKPELFAITAFVSAAVMLITAETLPESESPEAMLCLATVATVFAYFCSLIMYHITYHAVQTVSSIECTGFFSRARYYFQGYAALPESRHGCMGS